MSDESVVENLSRIRKRIGKNTIRSKSVAPHVLTAMEVNYDQVELARNEFGPEWKDQEGISLTYLPFLASALANALLEFPQVNSSISGDEIFLHKKINIGLAVDLNFDGLVVPVVRDVDSMSVSEIARSFAEIARRARANELMPDDMAGGTFTLTNAGAYGTMLSFPIINQPQVAILSTDGVHRKPVVFTDNEGNERVGIGSVGILGLAWDHRPFDGAYAAAFLNRVRELVENTDWLEKLST